jgi:hypothetical protein
MLIKLKYDVKTFLTLLFSIPSPFCVTKKHDKIIFGGPQIFFHSSGSINKTEYIVYTCVEFNVFPFFFGWYFGKQNILYLHYIFSLEYCNKIKNIPFWYFGKQNILYLHYTFSLGYLKKK